MATKRKIDTSGMFRSMTGHTEDGETVSQPAPSSVMPESSPSHAFSKSAKKAFAKHVEMVEKQSIWDKQSEKLTFYLTPRVCEAMQLYKSTNFIGVHNDSKLVNAALAEFFAKELKVLDAIDHELPTEIRLQEATKIILSNPDVTK